MNAKEIRIVYMGTPEFAVGALNELITSGYNVVGAVTVPDKPAGRGRKLSKSAVKEYIEQHNEANEQPIPLLQPEKLRDEAFISDLEALKADLFIVVAFRMLPKIVWAMPSLGTFNLHASLLPNYRGAAPINWAIINGEEKSGVTTFFLNEKIDCGAILQQEEVEIKPEYNVENLYNILMEVGSRLTTKSVDMISQGEVSTIEQSQDDSLYKPAPKIFKEDCELSFSAPSESVHNKVRGLSPYPAAWCKVSGIMNPDGTVREEMTAKILKTHIQEVDSNEVLPKAGVWQSDLKSYLRVATQDKWVYVDELQPQNKRKMAISDFLRGWR